METINTYFFDLIKVATEKKTSLSGTPNPEEWREIFSLANKQTLTGVLFNAIERLPSEQRPPKPLLIKWFVMTEKIKEQNKNINEDAAKMCQTVRMDGLRCLLLKGQGIATYYPKPELRTPGDIDLWVEGGSRKVLAYLRSKGKVWDIVYTHAEYNAPVETDVEIHHNPSFFFNPLYLWRLRDFFKTQDAVFENKVELPDGTGVIYMPDLEFNRYYILLHIYRHLFAEGIGLRQLLDYYYVLQKGGEEESKQRTLELFGKTGMMHFVANVMWVMQEVFGLEDKYLLCAPNEKGGRKLLDEIMKAGNFGKYDARINRTNHHKLFPRVWSSIKRKVNFVCDYPQELLFDVPMRTCFYIWKHWV